MNGLDSDAVEGAAGPYAFPNVLVDYVRQEPPSGLTTGWWRGVGMTHNAFMVEGFIDELAAATGNDPVAYRRDAAQGKPAHDGGARPRGRKGRLASTPCRLASVAAFR